MTATAELGITSQAVVEHAFERLLVLAFVAPLMTALSAFLYRWSIRRARLERPADEASRS